jgi:ribosomal protein S12 methylthiotransferase accessory factor
VTKRWREGGRRACPPEETWARLAPLLPVFGIARVGGITGLDRIGIPVFTACRPNSRSLSVFQGKGLTAAAARVSAAMEALETWCAETIDRPLKLASVDELRFSHALADLGRLPLASVEGVDPQLPFLWIEGEELMGGGARWLPFELVHANYALPEPAHSGAFAATTNGLASGNTRDEALLHALMEVIERDAITLWKLGPEAWGSASALRLETVEDPACRWLLDRFAAAGIEVAAWDVRSGLRVPCFLALNRDPTGETGAAELGGGAHPAPEVALARALTEAAQARATFIAGAREDIPDADYAPEALAERHATAAGLSTNLAPERDFRTIRGMETESFAGDIAATLGALRRAGIGEAIAVELSKPALPFAVVRVVVPGLEAALEGRGSAYVPGARAAALLRAEAAE